MDQDILDDIMRRLLGVRSEPGKQVQLLESEIYQLCSISREIFLDQPVLLELMSPVTICGDIHGQYSDLLRLFGFGGFPPQENYLFLGNYVGLGRQNLETICLLLAYKIKYPENFFLLRGNHECASTDPINGLYDECLRRYDVPLGAIRKIFIDCFNCLPIAARIDDKILCMHGGLSPDLYSLNQIRDLQRPIDVSDSDFLSGLLRSDPSQKVQGWGSSYFDLSYTFGADKLTEFLEKNDLDLLCRGHQVVDDGYQFFGNQQLVTIFSAPNYLGNNAGAIMKVDETLLCFFIVIKPAEDNMAEEFRSTEALETSVQPATHNRPKSSLKNRWCCFCQPND